MWKCRICGSKHKDLPTCFGSEAPWRAFVPESEFDARVDLTPDLCIIDEKVFLIRGHIEIPIEGLAEPFLFSVWSSLSETSMRHVISRWDAPDRANDPPYFGWLCTNIGHYPETIHLKMSVQSRAPGLVPHFTLEATDHPLSIDQHSGITQLRWHQLALKFLKD